MAKFLVIDRSSKEIDWTATLQREVERIKANKAELVEVIPLETRQDDNGNMVEFFPDDKLGTVDPDLKKEYLALNKLFASVFRSERTGRVGREVIHDTDKLQRLYLEIRRNNPGLGKSILHYRVAQEYNKENPNSDNPVTETYVGVVARKSGWKDMPLNAAVEPEPVSA